jgi:hypothetical protein
MEPKHTPNEWKNKQVILKVIIHLGPLPARNMTVSSLIQWNADLSKQHYGFYGPVCIELHK